MKKLQDMNKEELIDLFKKYNISLNEYNFRLYKYTDILNENKINNKYLKFIPKKLTEYEKIKYINKKVFNIL